MSYDCDVPGKHTCEPSLKCTWNVSTSPAGNIRFDVIVVALPSSVLEYCPPQLLSLSPESAVPLVSHPLSADGAPGREQSLHGALHVGVHTPPVQVREPAL